MFLLRFFIVIFGLMAFSCLSPARAHDDETYIQVGTVLLVPGELPVKNKTLVIENGIIINVLDGFYTPSDSEHLINLRNAFVMPGLMDMHVHLQGELGPDNDKERLRFSDALIGMRSVMFARKTIEAGFTTVRDLGAEPETLLALRDAIERGWITGPRIIAGSVVGVTGGHTDVSGMRPDLLEKYTPKTICDGPSECRKATRRAIKFGADWIKIAATGGVLSDTDTGTGQQMTDDELREVVQTAHSLGRKVAAHAHQADGINAALRAGVDSIEHGSYADDESIRLFRQSEAFLIPTLLAGETVVKMARRGGLASPAIREKALRVGRDMMTAFRKAYQGGVTIAFGTDSGVSRHGLNAQEALLMVQAGMTAAEVLVSATISAADLIGRADDLGKIAKGYKADIIALDENPLKDISALQSVEFVMTGGVVVKNHFSKR